MLNSRNVLSLKYKLVLNNTILTETKTFNIHFRKCLKLWQTVNQIGNTFDPTNDSDL